MEQTTLRDAYQRQQTDGLYSCHLDGKEVSVIQKTYTRLNDQAYALYLKIDRLWFDLFISTNQNDDAQMAHFNRIDALLMKTIKRCARRQALRAIPAAPAPIYSLEMGQVFATFLDGTTWLQTGPERWAYLGQYPKAVL